MTKENFTTMHTDKHPLLHDVALDAYMYTWIVLWASHIQDRIAIGKLQSLLNQTAQSLWLQQKVQASDVTSQVGKWQCPFGKHNLFLLLLLKIILLLLVHEYSHQFKKKIEPHLKTGPSYGITNGIFLTPRGHWKAIEPELQKIGIRTQMINM